MNYFKYMFFICLLGVLTSGLQVLAVCPLLRCFGKCSVWTSFCVQIGSIVMLVIGSMWRFSQSGRSCATNVKLAKSSLIEDSIATGSKSLADKATKYTDEQIAKAKESAGLGKTEKAEKAAIVYEKYVWYDTANAMKLLLIFQYVTMTFMCVMCICTCGAVTPKVNFWHS